MFDTADEDTAEPTMDPPTPEAALHPASVEFGEVGIGCAVDAVIVLSNIGDGPLTLADADLMGGTAEFELGPVDPGSVLEGGGSVEIVVTYRPVDTYGDEGFLRVRTDDPVEDEILVPLAGDGLERCR